MGSVTRQTCAFSGCSSAGARDEPGFSARRRRGVLVDPPRDSECMGLRANPGRRSGSDGLRESGITNGAGYWRKVQPGNGDWL